MSKKQLLLSIFICVFLAACTDYVDQMEGDFEDWKEERAMSSSAAAAAAKAFADSALASRRGVQESFSSLDEYDVRVRAYQYVLAERDYLRLDVENNELTSFDSLALRFYLEALPEEVEECAFVVIMDVCMVYDSTGFYNSCDYYDASKLLRESFPMRLDNLKKSGASRYTYYVDVPLGSLVLEPHTRIRVDVGLTLGISNDNYKSCESFGTAAKKRMSATSGGWSWSSHVAGKDGADYAGMPVEERDYGDWKGNEIPVNPYIVVTSHDQYISGISPSFAGKGTQSSSSSSAMSSSSYAAECTPVSAHKVTLSNVLQSSQSAINFETGLADNPHITIKFANEAATIIPGDGVTVYEDNSQTAGLEAEVQPGNTSVCREDFRKSTFQYGEELASGLWLDIVDASGNIYPVMVKKVMFESSSKGSVDIVYYN